MVVAFLQYGLRFFRPIQDLSEKYNILQSAMASSRAHLQAARHRGRRCSRRPRRSPSPAALSAIEFDHVWFAYKDEDWVLQDVSFTIAPGETIAVVGHTGAGKTTLISLLLRFYDVQKGSIRIGGVDVREFDPLELRRQFGVVLQDPYLFTGTLEENIRLGTETIRREEVEAAAEQVNLLDFIRTLPEGFAQPIRERGSGLSTGQKQLISFARALAHNPRYLILDEATSSVDTETEFRVREALEPHGGRPDVDRHRAPPLDDPARRPHPGDAQRPAARIGHAPGTAGACAAFTGSCTSCSTRTRMSGVGLNAWLPLRPMGRCRAGNPCTSPSARLMPPSYAALDFNSSRIIRLSASSNRGALPSRYSRSAALMSV